MRDLKGKTAFITGGASGIGLAMARRFGREGVQVMLADIEPTALAAAVETLRALQVRAEGVVADVTSRDSLRAAALQTIARFGKVHIVCNNAGVLSGGPFGEVPERDWPWLVDVNQLGVVHGMEIFAPLVISHGEGGHFVNTASMAGMIGVPGMEAYCATKFAVVAMSEGWAPQLAAHDIGLSVLCPGFVKTRIHESRRNQPTAQGAASVATEFDGQMAQPVLTGIDVDVVAERVLEGVLDNDLYIFTHPELRPAVEQRFASIMAAFDKAAASPSLAGVPKAAGPGAATVTQGPG
jgi:NAD(P)-dependent dehydrogenase (short-subunit alcohol dehydrogenase family)